MSIMLMKDSKVTLIGRMKAEEIANTVLIYLSWIAFSTSPLFKWVTESSFSKLFFETLTLSIFKNNLNPKEVEYYMISLKIMTM